MNLLLVFWNKAYQMGWYYRRALEGRARIFTAGPQFGEEKSDFPLSPGQPLGPVLSKIGEPIDWIVQFYSKPDCFPPDLCDLRVPKAWYAYDTHLHREELAAAAYLFDFVFCCDAAPHLRLDGLVGVDRFEVLPYAADPGVFFRPWSGVRPRKWQVGFSGSVRGFSAHKEREAMLERIGRRFSLRVENCTFYGSAVADFYQDCSVVLNHAIKGEMNMRVPETLLAGRPLLTPRVPGIADIIRPGEHAAVYDGMDDLEVKLQALLDDPAKAEEMARRGQEEALARHTYARRAETMLLRLKEELSLLRGGKASPKNLWLMQAAQFRYHYFRYPGDAFIWLRARLSRQGCGFADTALRHALSALILILRVYGCLRRRSYFQNPEKV